MQEKKEDSFLTTIVNTFFNGVRDNKFLLGLVAILLSLLLVLVGLGYISFSYVKYIVGSFITLIGLSFSAANIKRVIKMRDEKHEKVLENLKMKYEPKVIALKIELLASRVDSYNSTSKMMNLFLRHNDKVAMEDILSQMFTLSGNIISFSFPQTFEENKSKFVEISNELTDKFIALDIENAESINDFKRHLRKLDGFINLIAVDLKTPPPKED